MPNTLSIFAPAEECDPGPETHDELCDALAALDPAGLCIDRAIKSELCDALEALDPAGLCIDRASKAQLCDAL
ncbi:hypothetical protein ES703_37872 [subsurface metagenome]